MFSIKCRISCSVISSSRFLKEYVVFYERSFLFRAEKYAYEFLFFKIILPKNTQYKQPDDFVKYFLFKGLKTHVGGCFRYKFFFISLKP